MAVRTSLELVLFNEGGRAQPGCAAIRPPRAPMILANTLVPAMIEKGEGAVINIGSVSGKIGEANGSA